MKQFMNAVKPFSAFDENVPKRFLINKAANDAPTRARKQLNRGRQMFNSRSFRPFSRRALVAVALTAGAITLTGNAAAAPLPLFPFAAPEPQVAQPAPSDDQGVVADLPTRFKRQIVTYPTREPAGTIIIDTPNTYLYYVLGNGQAIRYGIGVGREGFTWSGVQSITKKAEWPDWTPPPEMIARQPYLPRQMAGGPGNPLGARAMYLGGTVYRIHGTNAPQTIGTKVSSGCIRLTNQDVTDLYSRVNVGTRVIVLPMDRRAENPPGRG
jgi:lipoprotein-anchoring transpeptidase ErfK/SrfK